MVNSNIMNSNLPHSIKRKVFSWCALPVLTHGADTWRRIKGLERKLISAEKGNERKMLGITWSDRKRASLIKEQAKLEHILLTVKKRKWAWAGHVMRRTDNRWTTNVRE